MRSIVRTGPLIAAWFDTLREDQRSVAQALRDAVLDAAPALEPAVKWGNLVFSHLGGHALAIVIHKDHARLQVFNGARLSERFPMLEGSGPGVRYLRLRYHQPVDGALVTALTRAVVAPAGCARNPSSTDTPTRPARVQVRMIPPRFT